MQEPTFANTVLEVEPAAGPLPMSIALHDSLMLSVQIGPHRPRVLDRRCSKFRRSSSCLRRLRQLRRQEHPRCHPPPHPPGRLQRRQWWRRWPHRPPGRHLSSPTLLRAPLPQAPAQLVLQGPGPEMECRGRGGPARQGLGREVRCSTAELLMNAWGLPRKEVVHQAGAGLEATAIPYTAASAPSASSCRSRACRTTRPINPTACEATLVESSRRTTSPSTSPGWKSKAARRRSRRTGFPTRLSMSTRVSMVNFAVFWFTTSDTRGRDTIRIRAEGRDGQRLNPRKEDLRRWRKTFAERLRGWGIEAEASSQVTRGTRHRNERVWDRKTTRPCELHTTKAEGLPAGIRKQALRAWAEIMRALAASPEVSDPITAPQRRKMRGSHGVCRESLRGREEIRKPSARGYQADRGISVRPRLHMRSPTHSRNRSVSALLCWLEPDPVAKGGGQPDGCSAVSGIVCGRATVRLCRPETNTHRAV